MRRLLLTLVSVVPLIAFGADGASAQIDAASGARIGGGGGGMGGGVRPGGLGGGGFRPGIAPGYRGGVRPGIGGRGFRGGYYPGGAGWGGRYAAPGRYYGYGRRGYYPYAGVAAGLALGAAAASPYYGYGYGGYDYPAYPAYETEPIDSALGGSCETPVKTCTLIRPAGVGGGCSCKVAGGRARGTVVP